MYTLMKEYVQEIHHTQIYKSFPDADVHFDTHWFQYSNEWMLVDGKKLTDDATVSVYEKMK